MKELHIPLVLLVLVLGLKGVQGQEMVDVKSTNLIRDDQGHLQEKTIVTYVANEGFLIQTENRKILVDALFGGIKGDWCEQPSDSALDIMINGQEPFDSIDVVLVSHNHSDHFNEQLVSEFMVKNPNTILVCPNQVNQSLEANASYSRFSERIRPVHYSDPKDTFMVLGDIQIRAMKMKHGSYFEKNDNTGELIDLHKDVEHIACLVMIDGSNFFHSGDASPETFKNYMEGGLEIGKIDFAFMDRVFMRPNGMMLINELIKPDKLIFMHIEPMKVGYYKSIIKDLDDILIFSKPLDSIAL